MKAFFTLLFILSFWHSYAQVDLNEINIDSLQSFSDSILFETQRNEIFPKNLIKINLTAFALYNNNISYERILSRKVSFIAGARYMPKIYLNTPYLVGKVVHIIEQENDELIDMLGSTMAGNTTYTGEVRFYTGKNPSAKGFYISFYGRYTNILARIPHDFTTTKGTYVIPLDGSLNGFAGGLMIGAQWLIAKRVVLDCYILGGHYGKLQVDMTSSADLKTMDMSEKMALKADIESINSNLNGVIDIEATITDQSVDVKGQIPFIGVRSLGISLGIAF